MGVFRKLTVLHLMDKQNSQECLTRVGNNHPISQWLGRTRVGSNPVFGTKCAH